MAYSDINIEKKVLAKVLMDREDKDLFFEEVDADCFSTNPTRKIFDIIKKLYMKGNKISPIAVCKANENKSDIVDEITNYDTPTGDFDEYLAELKKMAKKRELINKANNIKKLADEEMDINQYQNKAEELIFEYKDEKSDSIYTIEESLEYLYMKLNGQVEENYIKTGYPSLDTKVGGLIPGHLTVIAAPTSMGKTAFAISMMYNILKNGKNVIFVSLEMQHDEITERLLSQDSKVPTDKYRKKLSEADKKNIDVSFGRLMNHNLIISDERGLTTTDIKARCRRIARKHDPDMIIVDYLQNVRIDKEGVNFAKAVGLAVNDLRNLSKELNCNLMLLSQVNRGRDGVPRLSDLRDSGEIEENADEVWFPYRPDYDKDKQKSNPKEREDAKLILAKGRTVGVGAIDFVWYSKWLRWRDGYIDKTEGGLI